MRNVRALVLLAVAAVCGSCGSTGGRGGGEPRTTAKERREPPPPRFETNTYAEVIYDWRAFGWDFAPFGGPPAMPVRLGETAQADHVAADAAARAAKYDALVADGYTPIYQLEARAFQADAARDVVLRGVAERGLGVVLLLVEPARLDGARTARRDPRNPVLRDAFDRLAREARLKRREGAEGGSGGGTADPVAQGFRAEVTVWTRLDEPLRGLRAFTEALWSIDADRLLELGQKAGRKNVQTAIDTLRKWARLYPGLKDRAASAADRLAARFRQ